MFFLFHYPVLMYDKKGEKYGYDEFLVYEVYMSFASVYGFCKSFLVRVFSLMFHVFACYLKIQIIVLYGF